jgi:hypothetical protein
MIRNTDPHEWQLHHSTGPIQPSRLGLTPKPIGARRNVAHIERRRLQQRDASGRTRTFVHFKVRYRDATGKHHRETKTRLVDAERRKAEIEVAMATATWRDPSPSEVERSFRSVTPLSISCLECASSADGAETK